MNLNRYPEKNGNYSPSSIYTPGSAGNQGQFQHQRPYQHQQQQRDNQQPPRRRTDRYKRETYGLAERQVKQNDMIIRLLREIRDRLPPPPAGVQADPDDYAEEQGHPTADGQPTDEDGGDDAGAEEPR